MIDAHTHIEWKSYDKDRDEVIKKCKKAGLKAIVTSCARNADLEKTFQIVDKYKNYVFACAGLHPEFIKELKEKDVDYFLEKVKENKDKIIGIGEIGLDYNWIKEDSWQKKQRELFIQLIGFAKELNKPLVIHSRDAHKDVIKILENEDCKQVLLHMFGGKNFVDSVNDNGWYVSFNTMVLKSKSYRAVLKKMPLERIMLETDAPWLHPDGKDKRNDSTTIRIIAEKIAELRKTDFDTIWNQCGKNAIEFFNLNI